MRVREDVEEVESWIGSGKGGRVQVLLLLVRVRFHTLLDDTYDATLAAGSVVVEVGCKNDGATRRDSFYIPEPKLRSPR
jgi:hypothetical protein